MTKKSTNADRLVVEESNETFNLQSESLEIDAESYSLYEQHEKMITLDVADDVSTPKWLNTSLKELYQELVYSAKLNRKCNVVCFKNIEKLPNV